ncbi:MAG: tetratricopeptide repeat protein, partial [Anaerolineales bacterium]|nr:tetratricopeptide repeat protein [Anaerolineales bacterium]
MFRKLAIIVLGAALLVSGCQAAPPSNPTPLSTHTAVPAATIPAGTPTSTVSPTSVPLVRIDSGDEALHFGDYQKAREEYLAAFNATSDRSIQAAALWGLGRTELDDDRFQLVVETLTTLTLEYPESTYSARAYFLLGRAYTELGQFQLAADAYNEYLARVPGVLDGYVQDYRGDALYAAGDYTGAINAYEAALTASRLDDGLNQRIKIGQSRFDFGDYAGAIMVYDQVYNITNNDFIRAQMDYLAGNAHQILGQFDQANARYLHAVENYPLSYYSYLALIELVDANIAVDDLDRALVDYFAEQYDVALVVFDRYIEANPVNDGTPHYYRALTLREMQRTQSAIDELDYFIKTHPSHPRWEDAWQEKAFLEWAVLGDYSAGVQTLLEFVSTVPTSPSAPEFLMSAARVTERDGRLEDAAGIWERVANEYSASELVPDALFLAGIARYRLSDYSGALALFQRDLIFSSQGEDTARAYLWIGKTQEKLGDRASAEQSWQQAQLADPTGYYSIRARDILLGTPPFESSPSIDLAPEMDKERRDAEAWVRLTFNLPPETDFAGPGLLAQDSRFIRGTELWEMGMYEEARMEFESLREAVSTDPEGSFRLANHLYEIGLYRSAIFAAREVLSLAGLASQSESLIAPAYFNHIRYGLYYHDLILTEEERYGHDPLFMFSVIRQESLFEGFVRSSAGARGLMQVIPSTGAQIASELGWPLGYDEDDLYRPIVSVRFGSYYLYRNRDLLGGSVYGSLAAYNAGPGNALVWKELAGDDPDLFLEIVRFQETRNY